jgi:hypothetical protein
MAKRCRSLAVAAVLGLAGIGAFASHAGASVLSAADLAADCNDDGIVHLVEDTKYMGGSADIIGVDFFGDPGCLVDIDRGVDLVVLNVNLRAKGGAFLNIGQSASGESSITIKSSTIDMHPDLEPGGYLSIKTGCCGGLPGEADTDVTISNSNLRGTGIELGASLAARRGNLQLTGTRVEATGDAFASVPDIVIRVSVGMFEGFDGVLSAQRNTFKAPGGFEASTGTNGSTSIVRNVFTVAGGIAFETGTGGTCESVRNVPDVACS